eukprot:SAG11_NODE_15518_length_575_cov_1.504202_1_plen_182_part_10
MFELHPNEALRARFECAACTFWASGAGPETSGTLYVARSALCFTAGQGAARLILRLPVKQLREVYRCSQSFSANGFDAVMVGGENFRFNFGLNVPHRNSAVNALEHAMADVNGAASPRPSDSVEMGSASSLARTSTTSPVRRTLTYRISLVTSDEPGSGTSCTPLITINGSNATLQERTFSR